MRIQGWIAAAVLLCGVAANVPGALAQEAYQVSRAELLDRLQVLEQNLEDRERSSVVSDVGGGGSCGSCCDLCCRTGGWYGLYESVIVKPMFTRDPAFLDFDAGPDALEFSFDWDLEYSPRFEIGYIEPCCGLGYRGRYWTYDADTSLSGQDGEYQAGYADDGPPTVAVGSFGGRDPITASHAVELDVADLEFLFRNCYWTYSAGLRYAKMEQFYRAALDDESILGQHEWEGIGPTLSLEYMRPACGGWSVFTRVRGSILFGESSFFAAQLTDSRGRADDDVIVHAQDDLLPNGEIQLGVDWRRNVNCRTFYLTAALEAQYWLNAGTGVSGQVSDDDTANYLDENVQNADMGFIGFTVGAGLIY